MFSFPLPRYGLPDETCLTYKASDASVLLIEAEIEQQQLTVAGMAVAKGEDVLKHCPARQEVTTTCPCIPPLPTVSRPFPALFSDAQNETQLLDF